PDTREELQRVFFFDRQPGVKRVMFLATPHHGSNLGPSLPGRLAAKLIHLPKQLMDASRDVAAENPEGWRLSRNGRVPTSLDLLAPHSPALEVLAARPRPAGVHYHS